MVKEENKRKVERYVDGLEFMEITFQELEEGDTFRLFEPDGTPVLWGGEALYYATSDAYLHWLEADEWNEEGERWTIQCITEKDKGELKSEE